MFYSLYVVAYVRYDICVRVVTDLGLSDASHVVAYSREGSKFANQCNWERFRVFIPAPQSSPQNITMTRNSATTGSVEWDEMSWEDLRGWLVSYEIGYQSVRSGQCPPSDSTTNDTVSVDQEMFGVTGLDPGLQYCVWVAGRTSPGVGPFSYTLIPCKYNYTIIL